METETKETKSVLYAEHITKWDSELSLFVKEIGAINHNLDISVGILMGIPFPKVFSITVTFENGRTYSQSEHSFRDCFNKLARFVSLNENKCGKEITDKYQLNSIISWKKYSEEKPKEYGTYLVYRKGCDKTHFETWNNTGWAYNNNDITHWSKVLTPKD